LTNNLIVKRQIAVYPGIPGSGCSDVSAR